MMTLLFILILVILAALGLVSFINQMQKRERTRRLQQRQMRLQVELLEEVVDCLLQTLPNRQIAKHVNDEILDHLQRILQLERRNTTHIEANIKYAETRETSSLICDPAPAPVTSRRVMSKLFRPNRI